MSEAEEPNVLTIRKARWRILFGAWMGGVGLAVTLGLIWMLNALGAWAWTFDTVVICILPLFPVVLIGDAVCGLIRGERIVLSPEGMTIRTRERNRHVRWSDIKRFRTERVTDKIHLLVGWDNQDDAGDGNPHWEGHRADGVKVRTLDADLGTGWSMRPEVLCATLEHWRLRFTP